MQKEISKEDYWKVLRNEFNISEIKELFGANSIEMPIRFIDLYIGICRRIAYIELVKQNEIDDTKILNLVTLRYDTEDARHGDIGRMGKEDFIFRNGTWLKLPYDK